MSGVFERVSWSVVDARVGSLSTPSICFGRPTASRDTSLHRVRSVLIQRAVAGPSRV